MLYDAHVHMGYFARHGFDAPYYYSPRRVYGIIRRCDVAEFIVSTTCAQVEGVLLEDLNREAKEMRRISGNKAHVFLWVSLNVIGQDRNLEILESGLYEGLKLHEEEAHWIARHQRELMRILSIANERRLPVQFHSGRTGVCRPMILAKYVHRFQDVRFDFAHCPDISEMEKLMSDYPNIWTDTAYWSSKWFADLAGHNWHDRMMFGTDLPVWQAQENVGLTARYREYIHACAQSGLTTSMNRAFSSFVGRSS